MKINQKDHLFYEKWIIKEKITMAEVPTPTGLMQKTTEISLIVDIEK